MNITTLIAEAGISLKKNKVRTALSMLGIIIGVGAGAVVIQDVEPMTTVAGVPARVLKDAPTPAQFASMLSPVS